VGGVSIVGTMQHLLQGQEYTVDLHGVAYNVFSEIADEKASNLSHGLQGPFLLGYEHAELR
jgi:hypothetical protein